MQKIAIRHWGVKLATLALGVLAALCATYWVLQTTQNHSVSTAAPATATGQAALDPKSLARALGGGAVAQATVAPTSSSGNLVLLGVIAQGNRSGAALIAVQGKPAKPFRVGAVVDGDWVLQSVAPRKATLAAKDQAIAPMTLELPPLK